MLRQLARGLKVAVALAAVWTTQAGAQTGATGTIRGRVTDQASGQPIGDVSVLVVGTTRGGRTGGDGAFTIAGAPAGAISVRAQRIGYTAQTRQITVTAGGTAEVSFALTAAAAQLEQILVTAAGTTQRKRENGASVSSVAVGDSLALAATTDFSSVLSSRTPGVVVSSSGGSTGSGSRIRIRGSNSLSLSNDPLLIIDGIRANNGSGSTTIGVGGQTPSRFEDLNPDDIETVEVIRGPAAAALYGTAAANGVLQVTTKRGRAGKTRFASHLEYGSLDDVANYPANYNNFLTGDTTQTQQYCILEYQAQFASDCPSAGLTTLAYNPLVEASPFRQGYRESAGLSAAGGNAGTTYYVAGDYEREQGVYEPNRLRKVNARANVRGQLRSNLDVTVTTGYLQSELGRPQNDNNSAGIVSGGLLGSAVRDPDNLGYFLATPATLFQLDTRQNIQRFTGGVNANWQPLSFLNVTGTTGLDLSNRYDEFTVAANVFTPSQDPDLNAGQRESDPFQTYVYTGTLGATGTFDPTSSLRSTTTVGSQYNRQFSHGTTAFGQSLLAGTSSLAGTNSLFAVGESSSDIITIGGFVQEQLGWRDRVFVTGALRTDRNSAFGRDFGWIKYPAASLSWVVTEEPFFPKFDALSSLRLRFAYGTSGQNPGYRNAYTFFNSATATRGSANEPAVTVGGTGNPSLTPEKSAEYETGFDADIFGDRGHAEVTYYSKNTTNLLIAQPLAPSLGASLSRFANLGKVKNAGLEALVSATLLRTNPFEAAVTFNATTNANKVVDLGPDITPIIFGLSGDTQRHTAGREAGAYFQRPYTFSDKDGNNIITPDEVTVGDTAEYIGSPFPKREFTLSSDLTFFKYVRVSGLFDYRGGYKLYNATEEFRCDTFLNCQSFYDPKTSLKDQARGVAAYEYGTLAGYIEDADFWKFRELSVQFNAPQSVANRLRVPGGVRLTLAGRNLHTWTKYTGFDPEINGGGQGGNFSTFDFLSQPPVRYYTARIDLNF